MYRFVKLLHGFYIAFKKAKMGVVIIIFEYQEVYFWNYP